MLGDGKNDLFLFKSAEVFKNKQNLKEGIKNEMSLGFKNAGTFIMELLLRGKDLYN
jgi:hypothetical protein